MNFATRYRPIVFRQVVGQGNAVATLLGLLHDGLPNTILLHGPRSAGKTSLARILCRYANCAALTEAGEPCGTCASCTAMAKAILGEGEHPDLIEKNAANERGIDMVRELDRLARFAPRFRFKFIVLDESHALTDQAFQAALKLFEEPPSTRTIFVLCTTNPEKMPSTILSRCAAVRLDEIAPRETARLVYRVAKLERRELPKRAAMMIAEAAHGYPREALMLLQQVFATFNGRDVVVEELPGVIDTNEAVAPYVAVQRWLQAVLEGRYGNALLAVQKAQAMEYFAKATIETIRQMLHTWISPDHLVDPTKRWLLKDVAVPNAKDAVPKLDLWIEILDLLVSAQEQLKRYQVEPVAVMELVTYKIVSLVKRRA